MSRREEILNMSQEKKRRLFELINKYGIDKINPLQKVMENIEAWPVSIQQERVILDDELSQEASHNIEIFRVDISKSCTPSQIKTAVEKLISHNRILRVSFKLIDGSYFQMINNNNMIPEFVNMDDNSVSQVAERINIQSGSLIRFGLREQDLHYSLYVMIHHVLCDEWTNHLIVEELRDYLDNADKEEKNLELVDYLDYAFWQKDNIMLGLYKKELEYWKNEFSGLEINKCLIYSRDESSIGGKYDKTVTIEKSVVKELKVLSQKHQITYFELLISVYNILIHRLSREKDIVIGFPYANRSDKTNNILVFFSTTTAEISHFNNNDTFASYLVAQAAKIEEAINNTQLPLEYILRIHGISREGTGPFIDNYFVFEKDERQEPIDSKIINATRIEYGDNKFHILFRVRETENEELVLSVEYDREQYSDNQMLQLLKSYKNLLCDVIQNNDKKVSELELLSDFQKKEINALVNESVKLPYVNERVEDGFIKTANAHRDEICLCVKGGKYTYNQIYDYANKVCEMLYRNGVKDGDRVLICCKSNLHTIIIMLGVLMLGGTYVPVDRRNPSQRMRQIVINCEPQFAVVESEIEDIIEEVGIARYIVTENFLKEISMYTQYTANLPKENKIAYIMYTSGSTGEPKGVMVEHQGICRLVQAPNYIQICKEDRMLQLAPLSFDASTFEIWISLYNGIPLFIYDQEINSFDEFHEYLIKNKITIAWLTTGLFNYMVNEGLTYFDGLRAVYTGGEQVNELLMGKLRMHAPNLVLVNMYGPTENTTFTTYYPVTVENCHKEIVIGKPINNSSVYVLDDALKQVDFGVVGEICIGGAGLASGYFNDKELTDKKFFLHEEINERIYKSGDLGYIRHDGNLVFVGRKDNQIKIRGFRVELEEIESKIRAYLKINNCIISVIEGALKDKKLICFVLSKEISEMGIDVDFIKKELRKVLPSYMIPSEVYSVSEFKINNNGKIDVNSMVSEMRSTELASCEEKPKLEDLVASMLIEIYSNILGLEREITLLDNFFELGGHSLSALSLVKRIRDTFAVEVSMKDIYNYPSLMEMCNYIKSNLQTSDSMDVDYIDIIKESSYEQKTIFFLKKVNDNNNYSMPFVFIVDGQLNLEIYKKALYYTIEQNELLKASFIEIDGELFYREKEDVDIDELLQIEYVSKEDIEERIHVLLAERCDMSLECIYRFYIGVIDEEKYILAFNFHHIIFDGMSAKIFFEELSLNYKLYNCGSVLCEKESRAYSDYSMRQFKENRYGGYDALKNFWRSYLEDYTPIDIEAHGILLEKEIDITKEITISGNEYRNMLRRCADYNVTIFSYIISKVAKVFSDMYGKKDIVIGTPFDMRGTDYQECIGNFMNTVPIRIKDVNINAVQQSILKAFENRKLPYLQIVSCVDTTIKDDLVKIFVNQFTFDDIDIKISGCSCKKIEGDGQFAKFDVVFYADVEKDRITVTCQTTKLNPCIVDKIMEQLSQNIINKSDECNVKWESASIPTDFKKECVLLENFCKHVKKNPNAIAIKGSKLQVTYKELSSKVSSICSWLHDENVKKGQKISIIARRDELFIETLLSCIALGAVFSIVDSTMNNKEIENHIKAIVPDYVINLSNQNIEYDLAKKVILREDINSCKISEGKIFQIEHLGTDLFNMMCTSGTTGIPKIVINELTSFNNFIRWYTNKFSPSVDDCFSMISGLGHDPILRDVFIPLSSGGTIVIPDADNILSMEYLDNYIEDNKITFIHCTPHMLNLFSQECRHSSVKYVLCSGDCFLRKQYEVAKNIFIKATFVNCYGATETPQIPVYHIINGKEMTLRLPVGRGIDNVMIDVCDENDNSLSSYKIGQIIIKSYCISLGYYNDEEETRKKFLKSDDEIRFTGYKTGDLGYKLESGDVVVLGRMDSTVSVRGNRVELNRIKNQIEHKFTDVQAFVECKNDKIFVSVVSLHRQIASDKILRYLIETLPTYMIPENINVYGKETLTRNGKFNVKYISKNFENRELMYGKKTLECSISDDFKKFLELVKELIKENVCADDNFYAIGGNSLLAIKLSAMAKKKYDYNISAIDILNAKSFRDIENRLMAMVSKDTKSESSFNINDSTFKATPSQKAIWIEDNLHDDARYNMYQTFELCGSLDISILEMVFETLKERVPLLSCNYEYDYDKDMVIARRKQVDTFLEIIDLKFCGYEAARKVAVCNISNLITTKLELEEDLLFKAFLFELNEKKAMLLILTHHIVFDLTSFSILNKAISALYRGVKYKENIDLLPFFNNYYENYTIVSEVEYEKKLEQYKKSIQGYLYQPLQREEICENDNVGGLYFDKRLTVELTREINAFCKKNNCGKAAFFLTAYFKTLYEITGRKKLVVGVPVSTRKDEKQDNTLGLYVNTVLLAANCDKEWSFRDYLKEINIKLINSIENSEIQMFDILADYTRVNQKVAPFDFMFAFQNMELIDLKFSSVNTTFIEQKNDTSKSAIRLIIWEQDEQYKVLWEYNSYYFSELSFDIKHELFEKNIIEMLMDYR